MTKSSSTKSSPPASFSQLLKDRDYQGLLNNTGMLQDEYKGELLIQHLVREWVSNRNNPELNSLISAIKDKRGLFARNKEGKNILFILADYGCFEEFRKAFSVNEEELKEAIGQDTEELMKVANVREAGLAAFILNLVPEEKETKRVEIIRKHKDASLELIKRTVKQDSQLNFINAAIEVKAARIVNHLLKFMEYSEEQLQQIAKKLVDAQDKDMLLSALEAGRDLTRVDGETYVNDYARTQYVTSGPFNQTIEEFYRGKAGKKDLITIINDGDINALLGYFYTKPKYADKMRPAIEASLRKGHYNLFGLMYDKFGEAISKKDNKLIKLCDLNKVMSPKVADIIIGDYAKKNAFAEALKAKDFEAAKRMVAIKGNELDISGVNDDLIINAVYLEGEVEILAFLAKHPKRANPIYELVNQNGSLILELTQKPKDSRVYQVVLDAYYEDKKRGDETMYRTVARGGASIAKFVFDATQGNKEEIVKKEVIIEALKAENSVFLEGIKQNCGIDIATHNFGTEERPVRLHQLVIDGEPIYEHKGIVARFSAILIESLCVEYGKENVLNKSYTLGEESGDFGLFDFVLKHIAADLDIDLKEVLKKAAVNNQGKMKDIVEKFGLDLDKAYREKNEEMFAVLLHGSTEEEAYKVLDRAVLDNEEKYATMLVKDKGLKLHDRKYNQVTDDIENPDLASPFSRGEKWLYELAMTTLIASYNGDAVKAYSYLAKSGNIKGISHEVDQNQMPPEGSRLGQVMRTMFESGPIDSLVTMNSSNVARFSYKDEDVATLLTQREDVSFAKKRIIILDSFLKQNNVPAVLDVLCAIANKAQSKSAAKLAELAMLGLDDQYNLIIAIDIFAQKGNYEAIAVIVRNAEDKPELVKHLMDNKVISTAIQTGDTKLFEAVKDCIKDQASEVALIALHSKNWVVFKGAISAENITKIILRDVVRNNEIDALRMMKEKGMKQYLYPAFAENVSAEFKAFYSSCEGADPLLGLAKKYIASLDKKAKTSVYLPERLAEIEELDLFRYLYLAAHGDFDNRAELEKLLLALGKGEEWIDAIEDVQVQPLENGFALLSVYDSPATIPCSSGSEPSSFEIGSPMTGGADTKWTKRVAPAEIDQREEHFVVDIPPAEQVNPQGGYWQTAVNAATGLTGWTFGRNGS